MQQLGGDAENWSDNRFLSHCFRYYICYFKRYSSGKYIDSNDEYGKLF